MLLFCVKLEALKSAPLALVNMVRCRMVRLEIEALDAVKLDDDRFDATVKLLVDILEAVIGIRVVSCPSLVI